MELHFARQATECTEQVCIQCLYTMSVYKVYIQDDSIKGHTPALGEKKMLAALKSPCIMVCRPFKGSVSISNI